MNVPERCIGLTDSHCHLTDKRFADDLESVIARAAEAGVTRIVAAGGGGPIDDSEAAAELARDNPNLSASAGIHPHDADSYSQEIEDRIVALIQSNSIAAVGETGLDYYYENSPRQVQRLALAKHLAVAKRFSRPIMLHCRSAEDDLREVLSAECPDGIEGVVHCFTGSYEHAAWYLDRGLVISFSGILTFKNADELRQTAARLPLDRLMVETDSPYLAPLPYRGKRNEPAFVVEVAKVLAEVHKTSFEDVATATSANAQRLFFAG